MRNLIFEHVASLVVEIVGEFVDAVYLVRRRVLTHISEE
jgi:hypothetical protein